MFVEGIDLRHSDPREVLAVSGNHEQISLENDIPVCPAAGDSSQFDVARRRWIALEVSIVADLRHGKQVLHECIRVRLAGALGFGPRAVGLPFCLGRVQRLGSR